MRFKILLLLQNDDYIHITTCHSGCRFFNTALSVNFYQDVITE